MAHAYKCDICGSLYEHHSLRIPEEYVKVNHFMKGEYNYNGLTFIMNKQYVDGSIDHTPVRSFDCCPSCLSAITNFICSLKNKEKENA